MTEDKKLYRSRKNKIFGGVCGGFAEYYGSSPSSVYKTFYILSLIGGIGILLYIVCWIMIPLEPSSENIF